MFMPEKAAFCYPLHEKCGLTRVPQPAPRRLLPVSFWCPPMPDLHRFTGVLAVLAAFTGLTQPVGAQQSSCSAQGTVSTPLRGEGCTEQTGDIIILCIGGTTIAPGNAIPSINITVYYNTTVTSRLLPTAGDPTDRMSTRL